MREVDISLQKAGFFEERAIDIEAILEMYRRNGYNFYDLQVDLIKKYGDLEIHYKHPIWHEGMVVRLDPIKAQEALTMDVVDGYNEFLGDELLIIGDIEKENITLFMSKSGVFYGAYDDCIIKWGKDLKNMLSDLFSGKRGELQIMD